MKLLYLDKNKYYVYKHFIIDKNRNENIFYIGKGKGDRIYHQSRNKKWYKIVNENNGEYMCEIIEFFDNEEEALLYELKLQKKYFKLGQCRGCADYEINKLNEVEFNIPDNLIDKWIYKDEISKLIKNLNIKNIVLKDTGKEYSKGGYMTVNKFKKYVNRFGYNIESKRYTSRIDRKTMYKITKATAL